MRSVSSIRRCVLVATAAVALASSPVFAGDCCKKDGKDGKSCAKKSEGKASEGTPAAVKAPGGADVRVISCPPAPEKSAGTAKAEKAPAGQGVRAYIDPATGKLIQGSPAAEQALDVRAAGGKLSADQPLAPKVFARDRKTGMVALELPEDMVEYAVVTVDANGKRTYRCVSSKDAAEKALSAPAPQAEEK